MSAFGDLDEAERAAAGEYQAPRGEMLVTAPIKLGQLHMLPIVLEILRAFPQVNVRLVLADHVIDLIENHVDVAVRNGRLPDSNLVALRVGQIRWVSCASPAYRARRGTPVTPIDLMGHDCLALEGLQAARTWTFGPGLDNGPIDIRPRLALSTAGGLIESAVAGFGVVRMTSYQAAAALRDGRLEAILAAYVPEPMPVHLVHTGPPLLPLKLRAFLDFATPRLEASLAALPA